MKHTKQLPGIFASFGLFLLILDGKTALEGARIGIDLCLRTVIPSLFPFFLLSILLTGSLSGASGPVLRPLGILFGMPKGAEVLLIPALLGGYPVGAQCVHGAYRNGQLRREDAQRLLGFCSNAGPAFLFGMVASTFTQKWMVWVLWGIHITGAIFSARMIGNGTDAPYTNQRAPQMGITEALQASLRVMATVCGWVIVFRVLIHFLKRWFLWLLPATAQVAVTGLLELSNGCCELMNIPDESVRFILCSGLLSFGGLCVTLQTSSVTKGLSLRFYLLGKAIQTLFSVAAALSVVFKSFVPLCALLPLLLFGQRKKQKNSSIQTAVGV